ncbi:DUF2924 domain-containing protein [Roseiarcaceae bacterium H3SJ34-1]|uniref:DUF2924 domain-containing protein n=1 Tax=Terripilifer ovatus TaxID=3032367 RepID=UPI003AB9B5E8|nr:DUF2924 domain-containing protein [Roseiarcaceae bacterium H3SJ34-1]
MSSRRRYQSKAPVADSDLEQALSDVQAMNIDAVRERWRETMRSEPPPAFSRDLLVRALCQRLQEEHLGGLSPRLRKLLASFQSGDVEPLRHLKVGSIIVREHQDQMHEVMIVPDGYCWQGKTYPSLSTIAKKITGTSWSGPRFFGIGRKSERQTTGERTGAGAPNP